MADAGTRRPRVALYREWRAREYVQTYYSKVVLPEEQAALRYQVEQLAAAGRRFERALEYGCGPTVHRAIAAARYVHRLDMADWLPDNLALVRGWLDADAGNRDWTHFTKFVLRCEGVERPDTAGAARREHLTRRVVSGLHESDARRPHPMGRERAGHYQLIVSSYCLDGVSSSKRVWRTCMRNVLSMLAPGGLLLLQALHCCKAYRVGDRLFPCANVSVDDVAESLYAAGFNRRGCDIQVVPCPDHAAYGYSGILMVAARKRATTRTTVSPRK